MSNGAITTVQESILKKPDNEEKKKLQPKLFFWDNIIFYLASAILGLSVTNIVVDFLRPEPNAVVCFTSGNNRDHTAYINNYCYKDLPFSENFTLALAIHGTLILVPHYLWRVYFNARVDFFFNDAADLEKLRDRDTGKYPPRNFEIVDYLDRNFRETKGILRGYKIKLISQLVMVAGAIITTAVLFNDFTIQFHCDDEPLDPDNDTTFERVRCSYAKLRFISTLRWIDFVFLGLSGLIILYGLYWCLPMKGHAELGYLKISRFCFDSCINSKHYVAQPNNLLYHIAKLWPICLIVKVLPENWFSSGLEKWSFDHLETDLHFLLLSLFATDAGLGEVFKSVQIANDISQKLSDHLESLKSSKNTANSNEEGYPNKSFQDIMDKLHKKISNEQKDKMNSTDEMRNRNSTDEKGNKNSIDKMGILDIACGDHSYLFAIARCGDFQKIISIQPDPYYKNKTKGQIFTCDEYHAGKMIVMRIPTNLFGLPDEYIDDRYIHPFKDKINDYTREQSTKLRLVVVGPLDSDRKKNTVNQIIEMDSRNTSYFQKGSIMLSFIPLEVEGRQINGFDWTPKSEFWNEKPSYKQLKNWLPETRLPENRLQENRLPESRLLESRLLESRPPENRRPEAINCISEWYSENSDQVEKKYGKISIKCGNQNCKFGVRVYEHKGYTVATVQ